MINKLINKYQLGLDYCYELEGRRDVITGEANFIKKPKSDCYDLIELYKRILKDLNQLKEGGKIMFEQTNKDIRKTYRRVGKGIIRDDRKN